MRRLNPYTIAGLIVLIVAISSGQQRPDLFEQKDTGTSLSQFFPEAGWKLDSQQKYKEVRVPFTQKRGLIYVQALWAGKPVKCVLDTGATYIFWPQPLGLAATPIGRRVQTLGIGGGYRVLGEWVLAPSIQLGGFKLRNILTISKSIVEKANGQKISVAQAEGVQEIILGNYVFQNVVLTIDYQKQEVILRDRDYDITRIPHLHDYLLDLVSDDGDLLLLGQLAGQPARFQIDTGNTNRLAINSTFAQKYLSAYPRTKSRTKLFYGVIINDNIPGINGNIGSIKFNTGRLAIVPLNLNVDALIGEPFLRYFRVTIDYSRSKILLEPYNQPFRRLQVESSS